VQLAETRTGDAALAARVVAYESLGERGILTVRIQTQDLTILTPPDRAFHKAQSVWLRCPAEHLYFFSRDTGERLRMDRPHQEAAGPRLTAP